MSVRIERKRLGKLTIIECQVGPYLAQFAPEVGGNIIALRHLDKGIHILHEPPTEKYLRKAIYLFGMPVLMPPNRIENGCFEYMGEKFTFPIRDIEGGNSLHGTVEDCQWELSDITSTDSEITVVMSYINSPEKPLFERIPRQFVMKHTYTLSSNGLVQTMETTNLDDKEMPYMFGYHTAFDLKNIEKVQICLKNRYELNQRNLPTQTILPLNENEQKINKGGISLNYESMNHLYGLDKPSKKEGVYGATLYLKDGEEIVYSFDSKFGYVMLWNDQMNKKFICIEPQTCVINAPNVDKIPSGMIWIKPKESYKTVNQVTVKD